MITISLFVMITMSLFGHLMIGLFLHFVWFAFRCVVNLPYVWSAMPHLRLIAVLANVVSPSLLRSTSLAWSMNLLIQKDIWLYFRAHYGHMPEVPYLDQHVMNMQDL